MLALFLAVHVLALENVDMCTCYCCPGISNPYGIQPDCKYETPDFVGYTYLSLLFTMRTFRIGSSEGCQAMTCSSMFSTMCPPFPVHGPKNTSGVIRWGCQKGCRYIFVTVYRFGPDGFSMKNGSASDSGVLFGDTDSSGIEFRAQTLLILLISVILLS